MLHVTESSTYALHPSDSLLLICSDTPNRPLRHDGWIFQKDDKPHNSNNLRWMLTLLEKADKMRMSLPEGQFRLRQSKSKMKDVSVRTGSCPGCIKYVKRSKMSINPHAGVKPSVHKMLDNMGQTRYACLSCVC